LFFLTKICYGVFLRTKKTYRRFFVPKLNVAALKRLIEKKHDTQQKFLDAFGTTRRTIGKWYASGLITDKRLRQLCDHFSVQEDELMLGIDQINMEKFISIYEQLKARLATKNPNFSEKALIKFTIINYQNFSKNNEKVDWETFNVALEASSSEKQSKED